MKSFDINVNSWHYKLAHFGNWRVERGTDICKYTRSILFALLKGLWYVAVFSIFNFMFDLILVDAVLGIWFKIFHGLAMSESSEIASILFGAAILGCSFICGIVMIKERRENREQEYGYVKKPDGFIKQAYKAHKEKYCVRLNIVE